MKKLFHVQLENGTFLNEGMRPNMVFDFYIICEDLGDAINIAMNGKNERYYVVLAKEVAKQDASFTESRLILQTLTCK